MSHLLFYVFFLGQYQQALKQHFPSIICQRSQRNMELVDNTCSMHTDTHNHWKIYVWLTFEFRLLCFSFSLHKLLLQCLKLLNTGNEYQSLRKAICFRPHYTFKVQGNSSTFQGLTKKLSTFQGKRNSRTFQDCANPGNSWSFVIAPFLFITFGNEMSTVTPLFYCCPWEKTLYGRSCTFQNINDVKLYMCSHRRE